MSQVQSVRFHKNFFTKKTSKEWLKKYGIKPIKPVHETEEWYMYRILDPKKFSTFFVKELRPGLHLILARD